VGSSQSYIASTSGEYLVEVTNSNGCKASSAKTTVTVNSLPLAEISHGNLSVCSGESVILTSSQGSGYKWYRGTIEIGTIQTYAATLTGDYKVEVTGINGCKATSPSLSVQINVPVIPQITSSGPTTLCEDESVELSSSAGVSYEWYKATALVGTDDSFIPGTSGEYHVVVTDAQGCKESSEAIAVEITPCTPTSIGSGQDELKVQVFPNPFVNEIMIQHAGRFRYQLFDSKGSLVQQGEVINEARLGQGINKGLYLLRMEDGNREKSVTIVKE
jgi:hypothetical protein